MELRESGFPLASSSSKELVYQEDAKQYYANYYRDGSYDVLLKNSKEELYDFDKTHVFTMVLGWNWKFGDKGPIGFKATYLTNFAYTPITGSQQTTLNKSLAEISPDISSARIQQRQFYIQHDTLRSDLFGSGPFRKTSSPSSGGQHAPQSDKNKIPYVNFGIELRF